MLSPETETPLNEAIADFHIELIELAFALDCRGRHATARLALTVANRLREFNGERWPVASPRQSAPNPVTE